MGTKMRAAGLSDKALDFAAMRAFVIMKFGDTVELPW